MEHGGGDQRNKGAEVRVQGRYIEHRFWHAPF